MALLDKLGLLREVERGFESGGWSVLHLNAIADHPAGYRVSRGDRHFTVRAYICNISHGGGHRSASEYRIQITGLPSNQFVPETDGKTLILGYWSRERVFAAFDYRFHSGALGGSPSFQVGEAALLGANRDRFCTHPKASGELVVAFRPDFIGSYVRHLDALHRMGRQPDALQALTRMVADPTGRERSNIESDPQEPRRHVFVQTRKTLRALDFRDRVLTAYSHRCAICGMQLNLLDGAHILPVSEPDSTDETSNGVALCTLHHRAYDRALVTFDSDYRIHLNEVRVNELVESGQDGKLPEFRNALRRALHLPPDRRDRPKPSFVEVANARRGWSL